MESGPSGPESVAFSYCILLSTFLIFSHLLLVLPPSLSLTFHLILFYSLASCHSFSCSLLPYLYLLFSFSLSLSSSISVPSTRSPSLFLSLSSELTHSLDQVNVNLRWSPLHVRFLNQSRRHQRVEHYSRCSLDRSLNCHDPVADLSVRGPEAGCDCVLIVRSNLRHSAGIYQS